MNTFLAALHDRGVPAVHLGMVTANRSARAFYDRLGFHEIPVDDPGPLTYLGRPTAVAEDVNAPVPADRGRRNRCGWCVNLSGRPWPLPASP